MLIPLATARHAITFDEEQIANKKNFLAKLRDRANRPRRPNIVIILADDLGKTDISLYGSPHVNTPHIDAIGTGGVTFTEAYCPSAICSPSRAALLTGRYPQRFGYETQPNNRYPRNRAEYWAYRTFMGMGNFWLAPLDGVPHHRDVLLQGIAPTELTLAEVLQADGYATAITGKWHLGHADLFVPTQRGFDSSYGFYEAFSLYSPIDDQAIVESRHDYFADKHIWAQGRDGLCAIRRDENVVEEDEYLTFAIADEAVQFLEAQNDDPFFLYLPFSAPHTPFQAPREYYEQFAHVEDHNKRVYYAMIAALDDAVGEIVDAIDALGYGADTIIWFASDNGGATYTEATTNAPLKGGKFNYFEGGVNIPMMARWPETIPAGIERDTPVSILDIFATSINAIDLELPDDVALDGVDLMPHLLDEAAPLNREGLFWRAHHMRAARVGDWKLIVDDREDRQWLYSLADDKEERTNVAKDHPEVVAEILDKLAAWEADLAPPLWPHLAEYHFTIDGETFNFPL